MADTDVINLGRLKTFKGLLDTDYGSKLSALQKNIDTNATNIAKEVVDRQGAVNAEKTAREAADASLGKRIDNAETEISANSADLTGIKGLTYGNDHVMFLENENGSYTSPALVEIKREIDAATHPTYTLPVATNDTLGGVKGGGSVTVANDGTLNVSANAPLAINEGKLKLRWGSGLTTHDATLYVNANSLKYIEATEDGVGFDSAAYMNKVLNPLFSAKQDTLTFATDDDINTMFAPRNAR